MKAKTIGKVIGKVFFGIAMVFAVVAMIAAPVVIGLGLGQAMAEQEDYVKAHPYTIVAGEDPNTFDITLNNYKTINKAIEELESKEWKVLQVVPLEYSGNGGIMGLFEHPNVLLKAQVRVEKKR